MRMFFFERGKTMKKILVVFVVLVLAGGLYASTITFGPAVDNLDGTCTIPYTSNDPCLVAVAMALDVDITVGPDQIGAVAASDSFFEIFIAEQDQAGSATLPSSSFCISMGELSPLNDPCMTGTITLTANGTGVASGTLGENALRGGVIDEDGDTMTTNLPIPFSITAIVDCMQDGGVLTTDPLYLEWEAVGKPECWCYDTQCMGDADTSKAGSIWTGYYYVGTADVTVLAAAWMVYEPIYGPGITSINVGGVPGACADFDRTQHGGIWTGYYRVGTPDVQILAANWFVYQPGKGPGIATTCVPGTYHAP